LLILFLTIFISISRINFIVTKAFGYSGSGTIASGYISQNTTWTLEGSPYIVTADVIVEPDVYLIVEPGVSVKFKSGTNLLVDGILIAKGNSTHTILFTSDLAIPSPGSWGAIVFRRNVKQTLEWVTIKFANTGIKIENGEIAIANSLIIQNNVGVSITGESSVVIVNSSISCNAGNGLYVEKWLSTTVMAIVNLERVNIVYNNGAGVSIGRSCILTISQSAIIGNHGDGIQSWLGTFENCFILDSTIAENSGNGLYQDEWSWTTWYISGSTIAYNVGAGIYRQIDAYPIYVTNSTIKGNKNSGILGHIGGYVHYSNLYDNVPYDFKNMEAADVDATNNWWGITNETLIREHIYDYYDNYNLGRVIFKPFLTDQAEVPDDIPPVTTDDYDGLWHNVDFTVKLTAMDYESGVAETYYRINNGPVKAVSIDGQPLITTEGVNNTLEYWSVDNAGNEELPHKILTGIKLDKTASTIGIPSHIPEGDVEPDQKVTILANVTDFLSGIKNVTLSYNINISTAWIDLPMTFNSTTGHYEAAIQVQHANILVKYKIIAYDNAENIKVEDNNGQYYTYTVIPEFSSTLILALFMLTTLIATTLSKAKEKANHSNLSRQLYSVSHR